MDYRLFSFLLAGCILLIGCQQESGKTTEGQRGDEKPQTTVASDVSDTFTVPPISGDIVPASDDPSKPIELSGTAGSVQPSEITTTPVELAAPEFPKPEDPEALVDLTAPAEPAAVPETPAEPALPDVPKDIAAPAEPAAVPETPAESALPDVPKDIAAPAEPATVPETPAESALPDVPKDIAAPAEPAAVPETPAEPALPDVPKDIAAPAEPVAVPETPAESALPDVPKDIATPAEPVAVPETQAESALPDVPKDIAAPAEPAAVPETPAESALPDVPAIDDSSAVLEPLNIDNPETLLAETTDLAETTEAKAEVSAPAQPSVEFAPADAVSHVENPEISVVKTDRIPHPVIDTTGTTSETQEEELALSSAPSSDSLPNPTETAKVYDTPESTARPAEFPNTLRNPPIESVTATPSQDETEPPVPLVVKPIEDNLENTSVNTLENNAEDSAKIAGETPALPGTLPNSPVDQKLVDQFAATGNPSESLPIAPEESVIPALPLPPAALPVVAEQTTIPQTTVSHPLSAPIGPLPTSSVSEANATVSETETDAVEPYDPIKENGPIFVDWPKPIATLVITGQQMGYLEPCGCAGLERMKGGLSRRYTMIDQLRKAGWNVIPIDVGGMVDGFGKQAELKFHTTAQAMRAMGYKGVALGKGELGFPAADLLSEMVNPDGTAGMFVSCNASVFEKNADMPPQVKIIQAGSLKFGITSVLCKSAQNYTQNDEIILSDTRESLIKTSAKLKAASDIRILLSHGTLEESRAIAEDFPDFQVIVTAGGAPEPPAKPTILPSGQYIITVGQKGMNAVVLALFDDGKVRYQRVPQDSRFAQSEVVRGFMQSYQDQLKELWLAGLGIKPVPQTDPTMGAYTGPKKCATCHEQQYDIWRKTKHAAAFSSLEKAVPARHYDPECVCCHVVGWHRHLYFPYKTGFLDHEKDQHLKNVSCEACHGPGEAHMNAEASNNIQLQEELRKKLHIDLDYAKTRMCGDCHDLDNSPEFDFDKYWPQIVHDNEDDNEDE